MDPSIEMPCPLWHQSHGLTSETPKSSVFVTATTSYILYKECTSADPPTLGFPRSLFMVGSPTTEPLC